MSSSRYSLFLELIRFSLGLWLKSKFRVRLEGLEVLRGLKPPYCVVPNHSNTFDPFFVAIFIREPVYWVTSDANFRSPFVRFWLGLVNAIPKTKKISDLESVRMINSYVKNGGIAGIFAEGDRTWDGKTLPLIPATAKLIRMLKVPVLCPVLKGAFVSLPRWSKRIRRGRLTVDFSRVLYPKEYEGKSSDQVYALLSGMLAHDDFKWQAASGIPFASRYSAESLESVLFMCRQCGSISTLESNRRHLHCRSCSSIWEYTPMSRLVRTDNGTDDGTPADWFAWQHARLEKQIDAAPCDRETVLFTDEGIRVFKGYKFENGEVLGVGKASLSTDGITFFLSRPGGKGAAETTVTLFIPLQEVSGHNVVFMNQFEFYYHDDMYSCTYPSYPGCGIKWVKAIDILQNKS
ncbi:MAG: 1-acyl-sn-glycerol-3-phosphate acyltransferase [Spirochaetales bacterium]|nr:1-acyl-sn-glycerol-3-phosphate acyltransferase [Spirochaetales bacterium]